MSEEQQAVVDTTDAQTQSEAEGPNAQDELDTLLGEFQTQPETEPTTTVVSADESKLDQVHSMLQDNQQREANRVNADRITDSVKQFKEATGGNLTDEMAEVILQGQAAKDPRVMQAFANAGNDPAAWNKVVDALAKTYSSEMSKMPNADATADQDAVVAAVQSATTRAPIDGNDVTDDKIATMTSAEFNDLQRSLGVHP